MSPMKQSLIALGLAVTAGTAAIAAGSIKDILPVPLRPVIPAEQRACGPLKTPSGLGYLELKPGTGRKPDATDYVLVNYIGYLAATGSVFDQNNASPFGVGDVIPGFSEGLKLMPKGSTYRFCIPAAIGYGAKGAGGEIPPNADLVFQVELIDLKTNAEIQAMRQDAARQEPAPTQ